MTVGATASFSWTVEGGVANHDLHGDGGGRQVTYELGRGVPGHEGTLQAAFDGNHGWFWRNRGSEPGNDHPANQRELRGVQAADLMPPDTLTPWLQAPP